jgi:hypothetical protein
VNAVLKVERRRISRITQLVFTDICFFPFLLLSRSKDIGPYFCVQYD